MAVPVDVVLTILGDLIFQTRLVGEHVVALTVGGGFLQDVADIERREVWVRLKHQGDGPCHARCGHTRAAERHIPVSRVVLGRHDIRTNKGHVWLHAPLFSWSLTGVNGDGRVLVERPHRDDVFSRTGRSNLGRSETVSCGNQHGDSCADHLVGVAIHAVLLVGGPLDWPRATETHRSGADVEFIAMVDGPLHPRHDGGETTRTAGVKDLHTYEEGLRRHTGVFIGGCAGSCYGSRTVRAVTLVVIGLNFGAVGLVWIVHGIVERDDLGVVGAVVIVLVVKANVKAVDAGVDDSNRNARAIVARLLLGQVDFVNDGCVAVLHFKNAIEFQHNNPWEGRGFEDHIVRDSTCDGIDKRKVPLMNVVDLTLQHGDIGLGRRVVKVHDERKGVRFVQEERMVVVFLNHIGNLVVVLVHVRRVPPCFVGRFFSR